MQSSNDLQTIFELDPTVYMRPKSHVPRSSYVRLQHFTTKAWVHSTCIPIDKESERPVMSKVRTSVPLCSVRFFMFVGLKPFRPMAMECRIGG